MSRLPIGYLAISTAIKHLKAFRTLWTRVTFTHFTAISHCLSDHEIVQIKLIIENLTRLMRSNRVDCCEKMKMKENSDILTFLIRKMCEMWNESTRERTNSEHVWMNEFCVMFAWELDDFSSQPREMLVRFSFSFSHPSSCSHRKNEKKIRSSLPKKSC